MARIELTDVHVRYPVYTTDRQRSILGLAANRASFGHIARDAGSIPVVDALNGISFSVKDGDRIALIGRNGSGKTTILKVCAGLLIPNSGSVTVEGARACILSAGAGLNHDKTGIENVEMIGRLLGMSRPARKHLLDDVADFTELGDFLDLPVRTYSAGMMVRLRFALATSVERDVLIVDEAIGAGDAHFVDKAAARVRTTFEKAKILVIATHAGHITSQWCNRALWIDRGLVAMEGAPQDMWKAYTGHRPQPVNSAA
jgi:ABC-type polysaccharide/polyol phosphate transport system ATPase subunit